jgi:hypothetical protein
MALMSLVVVFMWAQILGVSNFIARQTATETFERNLRETMDL